MGSLINPMSGSTLSLINLQVPDGENNKSGCNWGCMLLQDNVLIVNLLIIELNYLIMHLFKGWSNV
jgi:hypothetical protein